MPEPSQIVFVVDDDAAARSSLEWLLKSVGLCAEAFATAQAFLDRYDDSCPSCLLLDLRMPGMGGLELQDLLASQGIEIPIIMITGYGEVSSVIRAMKAGAVDFIEKPYSDQALLERVQHALQLDCAARHARAKRAELRARRERLTPREGQVMELVVDGLANKQVAFRLGVSQKTVEVHRAQVMRKLEAHSTAELVRIVLGAE